MLYLYCVLLRTVLCCTVCCVESLTPRAALCAAQTVNYGGGGIGNDFWPARRDGLTVHSSGGGDGAAVYSGGQGCDAQHYYHGVCSGAPPAGTALRVGDTLTWAAGEDNKKAKDYEHTHPTDINAATSEMAGWELCFAR